MRNPIVPAVGAALLVFGLAACGAEDGGEASPSQTEQGSAPADQGGGSEQGGADEGAAPDQGGGEAGQPQMPEAQLGDVPDVVAEVNGEEIAKEDFVATYESQLQQAAMQAQTTGEEVDQDQLKQDTVQNMVGNELLTQEAESRDYGVTQKDLDQALDEVVQSSGVGSREEFMAAMEQEGLDEDAVMAQLEVQVEVDRLITEEAGDTSASEDELRQLYEQMTAQQGQAGGQGQDVPSFEEMKPQLEQEVQAQKESEVVQGLVDGLRENADVEVNL